MRDITLAETFNTFVHSRVNIARLQAEDNADYQFAQNDIANASQTISKLDRENLDMLIDNADKARNIAEKIAYRLGFVDGLRLMAALAD